MSSESKDRIAQLGDPVLRQSAEWIQDFQDPMLQPLIERLLVAVTQRQGVGIAAPQLSASYRLLVVASHPNERYPHAPVMEPTVMLNPRILSHNLEQVKGWEGCLSVSNLRGQVPRYTAIEVEYYDCQGHLQQQQLTDFVARIFQHEVDHLDGILFIDRVIDPQDLISEQEYRQRILS